MELADPRAESQPESRLRVLLALAGLFPAVQYTVRDDSGDFVARVDLAFVDQRVAIEYDGVWHGERRQFARDRRRLNRLVAAGWTVLHVTAEDLRDPAALLARIRALLAGQPKSWVHQGPPSPSATPMPRRVRLQSRMFRRWPGLSIQAAITDAASG